MKNLPIRLWISVMMAAIGLVRFVQSQFWSSPAHVNAHALEGAAEFFLGAWTVGVMHLVGKHSVGRDRLW